MVIIYLIALIALMVFGEKVENLCDDHIGRVYEDCVDGDPTKTHFALYGLSYWVGGIAFLSLVAFNEVSRDLNHTYSIIMGLALLASCAIFFKIWQKFNAMSKRREELLMEYLAAH